MAVGPKLRFDVFKRDDFTCRYCGQKTPKVILECDHIIPRAEGGTDEIENLVTACWACNRGKGATLLDSVPQDRDMHEQALMLAEREMQLAEYNETKRAVRARQEREIEQLTTYWQQLAGGAGGTPPGFTNLLYAVRDFPVEDLKDAIEIAVNKAGEWTNGVKYFHGILRKWREQRSSPPRPPAVAQIEAPPQPTDDRPVWVRWADGESIPRDAAEQWVVGAVLLDSVYSGAIFTALYPEALHDEILRLIYQAAMESLVEYDECNPASVARVLLDRHALEEIGGKGYLFELAGAAVDASAAFRVAEALQSLKDKPEGSRES